MLSFIYFLICFLASCIGAICGIGGGVIIKPLLDALHSMDISSINFLSGCTVLSMTTYSVIKSKQSNKSNIDQKISLPLAIGAALGGLFGKWLFSFIVSMSQNHNNVGVAQSVCLLFATLGSLLYTIHKDKINTRQICNPILCSVIGLCLGLLSSFLGIGGGPINLVVLYFFFSMTTKAAVENSLYIIFFSQITSLFSSLITKSIPEFHFFTLFLMIIGGILGGISGRSLNQRLSEQIIDKLFIFFMIVIIGINIYNINIYLN